MFARCVESRWIKMAQFNKECLNKINPAAEYMKRVNDAIKMFEATIDLANRLGLACDISQERDSVPYFSSFGREPTVYTLRISPYSDQFPLSQMELAYAALQGIARHIEYKNQARAGINESKSKNRLSHIFHGKGITVNGPR